MVESKKRALHVYNKNLLKVCNTTSPPAMPWHMNHFKKVYIYTTLSRKTYFQRAMTQILSCASTAAIVFALCIPHAHTVAAEKLPQRPFNHATHPAPYRDGEVIVRMHDTAIKKFHAATRKEIGISASPHDITAHASDKILSSLKAAAKTDALQIRHSFTDLNIVIIAAEEENTETLIARLSASADVAYAEPNYIKTPAFSPNDPYFIAGYQWYHQQSTNSDIDSTEAWDIEHPSATPTTVAFIDSGILYDNSELHGNLWTAPHCNPAMDATCPKHGWDFADDDHDPYDTSTHPDLYGHGSMVASIFAAITNNATGLAGMSRYNTGKIMALRFDLTLASELQAIAFAKTHGIKVLNASFGGPSYARSEYDALSTFDGVVVTAAGNGGNDRVGDNVDVTPQYPCNYDLSNIICVGASTKNDTLASFSNYGTSVDIAAPGESIVGTIENNTYYTGDGTSYAAAFVSGAAAMIFGHKPFLSPTAVRAIILASSDHPASLANTVACNRRLNLYTALRAAQSGTIPTESCATTPIYRFWSDATQGHFYTASITERDAVIATYPDHIWRYEGIAFLAFSQQQAKTTPVYRFWSTAKQHHFYTASQEERDAVIAQYDPYIWNYEGIAYYAYPYPLAQSTPVYRFWSDTKQGHFYTASAPERDTVIATYPDHIWRYEGIGWHIP